MGLYYMMQATKTLQLPEMICNNRRTQIGLTPAADCTTFHISIQTLMWTPDFHFSGLHQSLKKKRKRLAAHSPPHWQHLFWKPSLFSTALQGRLTMNRMNSDSFVSSPPTYLVSRDSDPKPSAYKPTIKINQMFLMHNAAEHSHD